MPHGREPPLRPLDVVALPLAPLVVSPAVSSSKPLPLWPKLIFSVQSPNWSLRLLSWLLIWARRDHRNSPAAAAPTAVAAAANGRSRASSITPHSLFRLELLLRPLLLLLGIKFLLSSCYVLNL